ncbi:hypothetical protein KZJ38_11210 [Paraburkholderia edwinii]|jgi:hypothetical protein|uniref:Uncharacterized protein n=1 Tax=Paraburkholderia edwinii TaxID=2861782 RepID=A0ABX8UE57_9BURK|nr:hypothetical protein [Paraburkholderia edwinii]QYD66988.1 hypothetical protein KZJ38_11210 [Paraburkholderia edwinii]
MKSLAHASHPTWYKSLCATACRAVPSGLIAGLFAAGTACARSVSEGGSAFAPVNAVTHCLWPRRALRQRGFSLRHTVTGFAIHEASAIFWAMLFETLIGRMPDARQRQQPVATAAAAAATAATAYAVDYKVVPPRLTPGFEVRLSGKSLAAVYVALGAGLFVAAMLRRPSR